MADVTLGFDELETNDLPPVCVVCGARRDVDFVGRRFVWTPLFAPPLLRMIMTKRLSTEIPLCPAHGGPRLFAHQRFTWWGLKTIAIDADRLTLGRVAEEFADALYRWREKRERGEIGEAPRRRRRMQVGRGPGGGGTALKVLGILVAVMAGLTVVMVGGMFVLMAVAMLFLPKAAPPPPMPPPPAVGPGPAANVEPRPEGVVVALLAVAPQGGPAALPWAPLALGARKETFHLLDDADLDKALADLQSRNPNAVAAAANKLTQAKPTEARRKEAAQALQAALTNPFPIAKEAAAEALGKWGTADDVPALIQMLNAPFPDTRAAAMTALADLKDERGAAAVAGRLSDFMDRENARKTLEAMGPVAEKAVTSLLTRADPQTRVEACGVLKAVGGGESRAALENAAHDSNPNVARAASEALEAVKDRGKGDVAP